MEYNLPEMLEIFEKMLKFDERVVKLNQLRTGRVVELKALFNEKIKKRIENFQYESLGQFFNSIDRLVYDIVTKLADSKFFMKLFLKKPQLTFYCKIIFFFIENLVPLRKLKDWAASLVSHCADNISLFESCSKCFINKSQNPENWFIDVCDSRHTVVWAKVQQSYWPAKVLKQEEKWITVQFFDGYEINKIIHKNIINYSDDDPNEAMAEEDIHRLKNSLEVGR